MDRQNVTLSLPKDLLREVRHMAVEKEMSLSALLSAYLERMLKEEGAYRVAMERARKRMRNGFDMGTGGKIDRKRDEIHER